MQQQSGQEGVYLDQQVPGGGPCRLWVAPPVQGDVAVHQRYRCLRQWLWQHACQQLH